MLSACILNEPPCGDEVCVSRVEISHARAVSVPYDIVVNVGEFTYSARCNDPDALETTKNSQAFTCQRGGLGFTLEAEHLVTAYFLTVNMQAVNGDDELPQHVTVDLTVAEHLQPNGPNCDPTCYSRTGVVHEL